MLITARMFTGLFSWACASSGPTGHSRVSQYYHVGISRERCTMDSFVALEVCCGSAARLFHRLWSSLRISNLVLAMSPPQWRLLFLVVAFASTPVRAQTFGHDEVGVLNAFTQGLTDPSGVLRTWDPALISPCTWLHITCNTEKKVVRVDLARAGLSGTLVPYIGLLKHLQYLELGNNNFSGPIPKELGNLTALVSLDISQNNITGPIPDTLGQLSSLRFLRLNNNSLDGPIPSTLTAIERLQVLDLSYNGLSGEVPTNGSFSRFSRISFVGNKLCGSVLEIQCPGQPPFPAPNTHGSSPQTQEPENRKVIILASAISAAVVISVIIGLTLIICCKRKHSEDRLQKNSKVSEVKAQKV